MSYIADIFNIKEEDTNGKRYNLRNADFVLPRVLKLFLMENTASGFSDYNCGQKYWSCSRFYENDMKKDVTSIVEGCGTECSLCSG